VKHRIFLGLLIVIFSTCSKNSTSSNQPKYAGNWEGTTSDNRPMSFHVNGDDEMDTMSVEIRVNFGSFRETRTFRNMDVVSIENDTFSVNLSSPMIFFVSGKRPVVHAEFTDGKTSNGTISSFVVTRGNAMMGTPKTNSSQTWTAELF